MNTFTYSLSASQTGSSSGTDITAAKLSLDGVISRIDGEQDHGGSDAGTVLQSYSYLGLDTIVQEVDSNGMELTYIHQSGDTLSGSDGGDRYTGLDRFGRVVDQWWYDPSTSTTLERLQYGYDPDGNVLYINNLVTSSQSELFHANSSTSGDDATAYDGLNRLMSFARGTLSASSNNGSTLDTVSSPSTSQSWSLDAIGNWTADTGGANGNETRTSNADNEIVSSNGTTNESPTYDHNGNMTYDGVNNTYIYDAWNRIVTVKQGATALENRTYYADRAMGASSDTCEGVITHMYYSSDWQVIEEQTYSGGAGYVVSAQYVWGQGYLDQIVERDDNSTSGSLGISGSGLGRRIFAVQDVNHDVTALVNTSASVLDRFAYAPYGSYTPNSYGWLYQFQGGRVDTVSGLYNFRNRDYNTNLGVWVEQDPSGYPDGLDTYQMLRSNPAGSVDPMALKSVSDMIHTTMAALNSYVETTANAAFKDHFNPDSLPNPPKATAQSFDSEAQADIFLGQYVIPLGAVEIPVQLWAGGKATLKIHPFPKQGNSNGKFWAQVELGITATAKSGTDMKPKPPGEIDFQWPKLSWNGESGPVAPKKGFANGTWEGQLSIEVYADEELMVASGHESVTYTVNPANWNQSTFDVDVSGGINSWAHFAEHHHMGVEVGATGEIAIVRDFMLPDYDIWL